MIYFYFFFFLDKDTKNNLVIHIPATKGKEKSPTICIQAHTDMVFY
jgi:di/tripeptidase